MFNGTIYRATNKITNESYIGQTYQKFEKRKYQHLYDARRNRYYSEFHKALRDYGQKNFIWEILETGISHINKLNFLEEFYIGYLGSFYPGGYNLNSGGENSIPTDETKRKIAKTLTGKKLSEEHKLKISTAHNGKRHSDETKLKMSLAQKGVKHSEETRRKISSTQTGKKHTEETRRKMSIAKQNMTAAHKRKLSTAHTGKNHNLAKAVIINGVYFDYMKQAAKELKINYITLWTRIKSKSEKFKNYNYVTKYK